jgi:hypothetical protein
MLPQHAENTDPGRASTSPALRLHAFDMDQRKWSAVHTSGSIPFKKLEALQCADNTLLAVGWSPGFAKQDSSMQVSRLAAAPRTLYVHGAVTTVGRMGETCQHGS